MDTDNIINSIPSRYKIDENEYNMMMDKFNKLNEKYNNSVENSFSVVSEYQYDILNLKNEDLMYFLNKAKSELRTCKNNMNNINKELGNYGVFLENINNLKKSTETTNKIYDNLLLKSDTILIKNRSSLTKNFYLSEKEILINDLKNEIEQKIENLKEEFSKNLNFIVRFKQLLLKASPDEKIKNYCNICATNKINICVNPCGHTFCQSCADKMNNCGMCRGNIISKIKLYIEESQEDDNLDYEIYDIEPFSGFNNNTFASNAVNV